MYQILLLLHFGLLGEKERSGAKIAGGTQLICLRKRSELNRAKIQKLVLDGLHKICILHKTFLRPEVSAGPEWKRNQSNASTGTNGLFDTSYNREYAGKLRTRCVGLMGRDYLALILNSISLDGILNQIVEDLQQKILVTIARQTNKPAVTSSLAKCYK